MKCCIVIQCFVKPNETLLVLNSLEKCEGIEEYSLILYVDKANKHSKFEKNNNELIEKLKNYKNDKFQEIIIHVNENNLGPYITCGDAIDFCFKKFDYVIFSEDDATFCKDSIKLYNIFRDMNNVPENCLGITASSNFFSTNNKNIEYVKKNFIEKINEIKNNVINENLVNKIYIDYFAPNKQFGLFKNKWEKIRYFRTNDYIKLNLLIKSDSATGEFVKNNNMYFYNSVIPRTNDIGLFHELGCTTLYYNEEAPLNTIKYITSNDFLNITNIDILDSNLINHLYEKYSLLVI